MQLIAIYKEPWNNDSTFDTGKTTNCNIMYSSNILCIFAHLIVLKLLQKTVSECTVILLDVCELLEHTVCRHLCCHLENNNNILSRLNRGFQLEHSCEKQLLTTINDILKPFDGGIEIDVVILNISKTFDTVPI